MTPNGIPTGRHAVRDFSEDLDFSSRFMLEQVKPPFGIAWSDLDKGCGHLAMAGVAQGKPVLRIFRMTSTVTPRSTPLNDDESEVQMNGRVTDVKPAGQLLLSEPKPEAPHGDASIQASFGFLRKAMPGWQVVWCRPGTTWPVAILSRDVGSTRRWLFVHVHAHAYAGPKALIDLSLSTEDLMRAMRPGLAIGRTA